jgi:hypothetical protein
MNRKRNALSFKSRSERAIRIRTKFSDLLKVMKGEARAGEEGLIAEIVYHWIESGRLKFIPPEDSKAVAHPPVSQHRQEGRMRQPLVEITI